MMGRAIDAGSGSPKDSQQTVLEIGTNISKSWAEVSSYKMAKNKISLSFVKPSFVIKIRNVFFQLILNENEKLDGLIPL